MFDNYSAKVKVDTKTIMLGLWYLKKKWKDLPLISHFPGTQPVKRNTIYCDHWATLNVIFFWLPIRSCSLNLLKMLSKRYLIEKISYKYSWICNNHSGTLNFKPMRRKFRKYLWEIKSIWEKAASIKIFRTQRINLSPQKQYDLKLSSTAAITHLK